MDDDIPYLLLTPGPLTTSRTVREAMLRDYCTWDDDYNSLVNNIRQQLVGLAGDANEHTSVLMQGSGTFVVESMIGTVVPDNGKLLIVDNGAYGRRIAQIAERLRIDHCVVVQTETERADLERIEAQLCDDSAVTHVVLVHCETTTGMLNPAEEVGHLASQYGKTFLVDAMSSFGGIPLSMERLNAQFLVSSSNKCIQGTPGFGFVVADRRRLEETAGQARSLSLDLFDQWQQMESGGGKWRYTSPTHVVRAFLQALSELSDEGGVAARHARYCENQSLLVAGMAGLGFRTLLPADCHSPVITSFLYPEDERFEFDSFYRELKKRRFVIYPGKVSSAETFRIGTIGHVFPDDVRQLISAIEEVVAELQLTLN